MKLVSFSVATVVGEIVRLGTLLEDSRIVDLNLAFTSYLTESGTTGRPYEVATGIMPPDMVEFFKGGKLTTETAEQVITFVSDRLEKQQPVNGPKGEKIVHQLEEVTLLAPVPRPNSIRDTLSFEGHMKNFEKRTKKPIPELWYRIPVYYKGNTSTVIGPEEPIVWPSYTKKLDYELEFGIYIGKEGKDIKADDAPAYIAGYTIFNDVSARDVLQEEVSMFLGPAKGKDLDTGNVMGPCLVTPDELDISDLQMIARINGDIWSEGTTSDMYWSFPKIIEHISRSETLYPGDFIASGTVANGCGDELDRWIQPGDIIELEVEGIGILRNSVTKDSDVS
jgi:2-keto-4-pentenoate hydratase/2-oxohepta-3-ene-1,7-dioic acid hydratase in catechol pathway